MEAKYKAMLADQDLGKLVSEVGRRNALKEDRSLVFKYENIPREEGAHASEEAVQQDTDARKEKESPSYVSDSTTEAYFLAVADFRKEIALIKNSMKVDKQAFIERDQAITDRDAELARREALIEARELACKARETDLDHKGRKFEE